MAANSSDTPVLLHEALEQHFSVYAYRSDTADTGASEAAVQRWAIAIHAAFYAPPPRGASSASPGNKFQELEATLTQVFDALSGRREQGSSQPDAFWEFMVRVVLLLAQEPQPRSEVDAGAGAAVDVSSEDHETKTAPVPATEGTAATRAAAETSGKDTKKQKRRKSKKKSAQPNAPLAFVVLSALKKLSNRREGGNDDQGEYCVRQGQANAALKAFCLRGLETPESVDQKLLVEILDLFQLTHFDKALVLSASERLLVAKSYSAAIKLCGTFGHFEWPFEKMIKSMTHAKDWVSAELLVRNSERERDTTLTKILIEEAIHLREFKRVRVADELHEYWSLAHRLVHSFNLQQDYPDIGASLDLAVPSPQTFLPNQQMIYSRDGLVRLIEKQRWQLALSFVGNDATLQKTLFDRLVAAGEIAHARTLAERLGIVDFEPNLAQLASQMPTTNSNVGSHRFLHLPLNSESITFCDDEQHVREAMRYFFDDVKEAAPRFTPNRVVGLDVEWKPTTSRFSAGATASILQIATSSRVFIVDLLALHVSYLLQPCPSRMVAVTDGVFALLLVPRQDNDFLFDSFLQRLFSSKRYVKVGFGFDSDMKENASIKLGRSAIIDETSAIRSIGCALPRSNCGHAGAVSLTRWICSRNGGRGDQKQSELGFAWEQGSEFIGALDNPSVLFAEAAAAVIRWRHEYIQEWHHRLSRKNTNSSNALTPQDIVQFWEKRKAAFLKTRQAVGDTGVRDLDFEIKFLPSKTVRELLDHTQNPDKPQDFAHINSICFFADGVFSKLCKLDTAQLALFCGVGRRKVKLATAVECIDVFGFPPGAVPPFGHRQTSESSEGTTISIYVDASLKNVNSLLGGGGSHEAYLWVSSKAFFSLIGIERVGNISFVKGSTRTIPPRGRATEENGQPEAERKAHTVEYRFVADTMASQVARWLRSIGVDVVTWNPEKRGETASGSQSHRAGLLAFAIREQRIIITRDTQLASRRDAGACFVLSSDVCYKQFREIKTQFGLYARKQGSTSRCARCNSTEFTTIDAEYVRNQAREDIQAKVLKTVTNFWMCLQCEKIYWEGPKYTTSTVANGSDGEVLYQPVERKRRPHK